LDLDKLRLLTGGEVLGLRIDESSPLGSKLVAFASKIEDYKNNARTLKEEIETLGTKKSNLATQIETLHQEWQQNQFLQQNKMVLIKQLFTKLIAKNMELIEEKTELIAKNMNEVQAITRELETFIKDINAAHCEIQNKFPFVKTKGNESQLTVTSRM
jgi:DNA repair exonuclease SbcCD ATPase subunit